MTDSSEILSPLKRAILEIRDLRTQLTAIEQTRTEPIAIVGLGLRFPGDSRDADSFWRILHDGVDTITEVPPDRWNVEAYYAADPQTPGKMSTRYGAFLNDVDRFDAAFFGIAPREAVSMDPQQRLLLEVAWQALENAGQSPENLSGGDSGVFLGIANSDYYRLLFADEDQIDTYAGTGTAFSVAAGRLSYVLGWHGPTLAIDTACSSSLVAVHLACQSLRRGECRLALAGGVNMILQPELTINFSKANMLAPDGRCKTFDARADGYVRGEGCGLIVLKRLSDAVADHDRVLAIIRGTAINHDGRSGGLTAPNGPAQEAVIRAALVDAGVDAAQVSYVEAHGTGTSLGDPIEMRALGAVYGAQRTTPLIVGSAKTNLGHLEAAAGVAGLIKMVLMLQHGEIPAHLHFQQPNPYIEWDRWPIVVPTQSAPWSAQMRVAGVSSFGFSGTNAHLIMAEAPPAELHPIESPRLHVLTLSAKSEMALKNLAALYAEQLREQPASWADVCFTANTGRSHFTHRLALLAAASDEARDQLTAFNTGQSAVDVFSGTPIDFAAPGVAFLFTGHGSHYAGLSRRLYEQQPAFRAALDGCAEILRSLIDPPLLELLAAPSEAYAQPALFAVEYSLAELWKTWGVQPAIVLGHSLGEYAAACVAGVFSVEDGLKLAVARDRLMRSLPTAGEMVTVFADEATVTAVLAHQSEVAIAAINSPESVVISGRREAVAEVVAQLQARKIRSRRLPIGYASHSPLIEPILDEFERIAAEVHYRSPQIAMASSLTGRMIEGAEIANAAYWRRHLRSTVRFAPAVQALYAQGYRAFVEIGPNPTLISLGQRCVPDSSAVWLSSLREGVDDERQMFETLAALYVNGVTVDWNGFERDAASERVRVPLPTYPFERKSFWWKSERAARTSSTSVQRWTASAAAARRQARQAPLDLALTTYAEKWRRLDELSVAHITRSLRELGLFTRENEQHTLDELVQQAGISETYRHLIERWLDKLMGRGWVQRVNGSFSSAQSLPVFDVDVFYRAAQQVWSDAPFLLDYVQSCGAKLSAVITGRESPLETLFPGGSFETVENLYQNWVVARYFNGIVQAAVEAGAHATPDRALRVIEVGAGTGATSSFVLPVLPPDRSIYQFTDVSEVFLGRARDKFAAYPFVRYGLLDVECDPGEQGYMPHSFDVVIAANVLHATVDLAATLQHVQTLLSSDGVLVLFEATTSHGWFDTTTGLIEGWQRFADDVRHDSPLLSPVQWSELLQANGFVEVVVLPEAGSPAEILGQHVILARAPTSAAFVPLPDQIDEVTSPAAESAAPAAAPATWLTQLRSALPDERSDLLIEFVRSRVAKVLRLDPADPIDRRARLMDLGVDSLMAIELRNLLSAGLEVSSRVLPATLIFDYPTIEAIASYLASDVLQLNDSAATPAPDRAAPPAEAINVRAAELAELSDDAVEALLLEKLKSLPK